MTEFKLKTSSQVLKDLDKSGRSIADFARENGLKLPTVYRVLKGTNKGKRGEAHRAAVLLGMKVGTVTNNRR